MTDRIVTREQGRSTIQEPETPTPYHSYSNEQLAALVEPLHQAVNAVTIFAATGREIAKRLRAADEREAGLQRLEDRYQRDCFGLNNEGDPIGGDLPAGWKPRAEKAEAEAERLRAAITPFESAAAIFDPSGKFVGGESGECLCSFITGEHLIEAVKARTGA